MESVGFKEWAIVCDALARGEQSIILRKGGIAEGRDGFAFKHAGFFFVPTWFHEQLAKTRLADREIPPQREGEIEIRVFGKVEFTAVIDSWETALALEPFHIWQREVVRERFGYDDANRIHFAFVRAFRLSQPWIIADRPAYGGCRSWVKLPAIANDYSMKAILTDRENRDRCEHIETILGSARS